MNTANLTITLDEELVKQYEESSPAEKQKAQLLIELLLRQMTMKDAPTLLEVMDKMAEEAKERGLTDEILKEILDDE